MLLPTVQIGSPPVESPAGDPAETRQTRDMWLEVPRGDEQRRLLEEFARSTDDETYRVDEGFFEKLKSAFR